MLSNAKQIAIGFFFLSISVCFAQSSAVSNCNQSGVLTGNGASPTYSNIGPVKCTAWVFNWWSSGTGIGTSGNFQFAIEIAPDNGAGTGTPGAFVFLPSGALSFGVQPTTVPTVTQGSIGFVGYFPYLNVTMSSYVSGSLYYSLVGYTNPPEFSLPNTRYQLSNTISYQGSSGWLDGIGLLDSNLSPGHAVFVEGVTAANLSQQPQNVPSVESGMVTEKGARWSLTSNPGGGAQAIVTKAAGGAGVKHVADCISFSAVSTGAVTAAVISVLLIDNGSTIWQLELAIPTATGIALQEIQPFQTCGLNYTGTANASMILELGTSGVTNVAGAVNLSGYDVQ